MRGPGDTGQLCRESLKVERQGARKRSLQVSVQVRPPYLTTARHGLCASHSRGVRESAVVVSSPFSESLCNWEGTPVT